MAKTFSWTRSYRQALQETEDNQILDATLSVAIVLLWRSKHIGLKTFGPEQPAIRIALDDSRAMQTTSRTTETGRVADHP